MAKPKHDYDSDKFYALLERAASVCYLDKDVAVILDLDEETFCSMKNGNYIGWTQEENERRGDRILKVLTRARVTTNMQAWNTVLRVGLGKYKSRQRSVRAQGKPCQCGGKNHECPLCGGLGYVKDADGDIPVTVTETETELAPSLQAITTWLYHHDPNYRRIQKGEEPMGEAETANSKGVDIGAWLRREMLSDINGQNEEPKSEESEPQ